ncbi:MAG: hypothetical protein IKP99_05660 [Bacteroidales bacterium]|nr:hypothetical protein [Bacteroidales bacterium]
MANKKISELNPASALQSTDLMAVVQENQGNNENPLETRKTTVGALKTAIVPSFQSGDGSLTVTEQGNQVDLRVANNNVAAGYVEDFPLSMAEGGQNVPVGFYGVRFSPGQNFIAKHAQICKRDNMTSGTFVVAIYSAGTTATGGRTEGMELLAQTTQTSMSGNGIGTADFPESQQIELEADHEYYMVVYVQHPSSGTRGLICRKLNGNEWGNSNLTLAFSGTSQTVASTLGSSNFSTLYPSSSVNTITLPYIKIYGDSVAAGAGQIPPSQILVINDNNASQYFTSAAIGSLPETVVKLSIPDGYSTFLIDTTISYTVVKILPQNEIIFSNYKRIMIIGNVEFWAGVPTQTIEPASGDYRVSQYWYAHRGGSHICNEGFAEFILRNKVWYSVFY